MEAMGFNVRVCFVKLTTVTSPRRKRAALCDTAMARRLPRPTAPLKCHRASDLARKEVAASYRKRRQFRNDRHALAFARRAPGKIAGQCCRKFRASERGA